MSDFHPGNVSYSTSTLSKTGDNKERNVIKSRGLRIAEQTFKAGGEIGKDLAVDFVGHAELELIEG